MQQQPIKIAVLPPVGRKTARACAKPTGFCNRLYSAAAALCLLSGCVSLTEKAGRVLDGSAFAEKTVALYRTAKTGGSSGVGSAGAVEIRELRNKAGEKSISIALDGFPMVKLRGSAPDKTGVFYFSSLDYLGSSLSGWNEYSLELSGTGTLLLGEKEAVFSIPGAPETIEISQGRIHRYDTRLGAEEALTSLRNRRDRITALAEWMKGRKDAPAGLKRKDFEKYWKPVLLPEIVSSKKRPPGWLQEDDEWARAEDVRWNSGYTGRVFPEELISVRDSGTLLRDWEEALPWIYLEYEWERIFGSLSPTSILQRIK